MKKNIVILLTLVLTVICATLYFSDIKMSICGDSSVLCWRKFNLSFILTLLGPAILIAAVISLSVSEAAFKSWKKLTLYFIPFYILVISVMPWSVGDEFAGFTKAAVGLFLCVSYVIFSTLYLLIKRNKV